MKKLISLFISTLIMTILLVGCNRTKPDLESADQAESSVDIDDNNESISAKDTKEIEKEKSAVTFRIKSCPAETPEGTVYHWAMLQTGRKQMDEENMRRINERLQALGIDGSLQIHYVEIPSYGLVTAETIQQVYEQLEGKMDFISVSPAYIALSKDDWQDNFIELTEELHTGALKDFYEIVPDNLWKANEIAGGIYSFSSAKEVEIYALYCREPMIEEMGLDNICRIQEANGLENEKVWKELYELRNKPIAVWDAGISAGYTENEEGFNSYSTLTGFTGMWEKQYFERLNDMDYIRYNFEINQYEWLGESEKYLALRDRILEFYDKGYLTNVDYEMMYTDRSDEFYDGVCRLLRGVDNEIHEDRFDEVTGDLMKNKNILIPMWNEMHVVSKSASGFLYSCVYQGAQAGWDRVLNMLGSDDELICLINFGIQDLDFATKEPRRSYSVLLSSELYNTSGMSPYGECMEESNSAYEFLEKLYGNAVLSDNTDFVFNPAPVQEELKKCNTYAGLLSDNECTIRISKPGEESTVEFSLDKVLSNWDTYISTMGKNAPVQAVVEEANRQLAEWRKP